MRLICGSTFEIIIDSLAIDNEYSYVEYYNDYNREVFRTPYDKIVKKLKLR